MLKLIFKIFLLLSSGTAFAQKELFLTTSAGLKISYNQLETDKPLPDGIVRYSNWSGFSSNLGLEYKIKPNWAVHLQVKTSTVTIGIVAKSIILDTASGITVKSRGRGYLTTNGHAPAHIQLGGTYYSKPLAKPKFSWLLGGGVAYLVNVVGFAPGIQMNPPENRPGYVAIYGKFIGQKMDEDYSKNGILLNIHTGIDFNFAPKHHLLLTLQHNAGLINIWQFKSDYFYYVDIMPDRSDYEQYNVKIRTKGSYTALQLGYKYSLFRKL